MQKLTLTSKVKFLESKYKKAVGKYLNQELKQKDLTYIEFVLVSSGINENFDGYPKQRIAEVYKTPIHKPIDCYHLLQEEESYIRDPLGLHPHSKFLSNNVNTIIGSIVDSILVDDEGNVLPDDEIEKLKELEGFDPENPVHVVCLAGLYEFFFPQTINDIKRLVDAGKMFVSVEAFFSDWSYYLIEKKELIERTPETEFLDDCIGKTYKGSTVARILNDFIIGGAGFTSNPANPSSIILSLNNEDTEFAKKLKSYLELHDKLHSIYPSVCEVKEAAREIEKAHAEITRKIKEMVS